MKSTYKIALIAAVVLCVIIIVVVVGRDDGQTPQDVSDAAPQQAETTQNESAPPADAPADNPTGLMVDLRDRVETANRDDPAPAQSRFAEAKRVLDEAQSQADSGTSPPTPPAEPEPAAPQVVLATPLPPPRVIEPQASDTPAVTGQQTTYIVEPNDSFYSIAIKLYGDDRHWQAIAKANPLVDPLRLKVGQELRLPVRSALADLDKSQTSTPDGAIVYTIQPGDNLSDIARQYYNDPLLWNVIFDANREKLGGNPDAIQAGMTITIPPVPHAAE